jgi:hypothetical protein
MSHEYALEMCALAARETGLKPEDFVVDSTGSSGKRQNIAAIERGMPEAVRALSKDGSRRRVRHYDHRHQKEGNCPWPATVGRQTGDHRRNRKGNLA